MPRPAGNPADQARAGALGARGYPPALLGPLLALGLLLAGAPDGAPAVRADTATPAGQPLTLAGRAGVARGQTLVVQAGTDSDDGVWGLEVRLSPRDPRAAPRPDEPLELTGDFSLAHASMPPATGAASGVLVPDGTVPLHLSDASGALVLDGTVTAGSRGAASVTLTGRFPGVEATTAAQAAVDHTAWWVSRTARLTAYALLFVNVGLGPAVRTRFTEPLLTRWRASDLHQFTALLALGLVAVHALALLADRFAGFTPRQLLVPLALTYRRAETGIASAWWTP